MLLKNSECKYSQSTAGDSLKRINGDSKQRLHCKDSTKKKLPFKQIQKDIPDNRYKNT